MSVAKFFAVLSPGQSSAAIAFRLLKESIMSSGVCDKKMEQDFENAQKKIQKRGTSVLPITVGPFEFDFAQVNHKQIDWISLTGATISSELCEIMAKTIFHSGFLIMAVVLDREYDYWQNAEDPLQYKAAGRSFSHLPMRSNGLPPPLNQDVVDISNNPGRRSLRSGFVEIVGYLMWITESFWKLAGTDKTALNSVSDLTVNEDVPGLIRIQAGQSCFSSSEGESVRLQNGLRSALFVPPV